MWLVTILTFVKQILVPVRFLHAFEVSNFSLGLTESVLWNLFIHLQTNYFFLVQIYKSAASDFTLHCAKAWQCV